MTDETKLSALDRARKEVELCQKVFGEDRNGWTRASRALAALVAELDAAPVVHVNGVVRYADGSVSVRTTPKLTDASLRPLLGKRVRLVGEGE